VDDAEQVDLLGGEEGVHRIEGEHDRVRRRDRDVGRVAARTAERRGEGRDVVDGHRALTRRRELAAHQGLINRHAREPRGRVK
jgi:hypothetical protein